MKRSDLIDLESIIMKEVVRRRQLGGYSPDADGILLLSETLMRLLQHTIETYNNPLPDVELQIKQVRVQNDLEDVQNSRRKKKN